MDQTLKALKEWLKKPENTPTKLAGKLGYKTSETVRAWVRNGHIPEYMKPNVLKEIQKR